MKFDQELQIQAYLDRELSAREVRQVEELLAADREAQALLAELKMTRSALIGNEPEIAVAQHPATEDKAHDALANAQPWPSERPVLQEIVSELEASLGSGFLGETESAHVSGDIPETVSAHAPAEFRQACIPPFSYNTAAQMSTRRAGAEDSEPCLRSHISDLASQH